MIGEKIYCGLDIGSQKIKTSLLKIDRTDRIEILGIHESLTRGLSDASIKDLAELSECIHRTIQTVAKRSGEKIRDVQLGIGGSCVEARYSTAVIPLVDKSSKVITARDIEKVNKNTRLLGVKVDEEILHSFPQHYLIDDHNKALNPFGLYGRKLEAHFLLIISPTTFLSNISKAIHQAGYDVQRTSFASLLSSEISLEKRTKSQGCVFVDIGASATNLLFFKDQRLREMRIIPIGGNTITQSISRVLNLPFELAEDIKKSYAVVLSDKIKNNGEILIKKDSHYIPIQRKHISDSIEPEVKWLIGCIKDAISSSSLHDQLNAGVIVAGGGSLLSGLIERIEEATNLPTKVGSGYIRDIGSSNAATVAASIGLARCGGRCVDNYINTSKHNGSFAKNFTHKIREFYQEYF